MLKKLRYAAPLAMMIGLFSGWAQQSRLPAPRTPEAPKITSVEELMPYARYYVKTPFVSFGRSLMKPSLGAKAGDKILLISEASTDPLVIEAVRKAALEVGAEFNVILLHGYPRENDPVKLELIYLCKGAHELLPDWVWKAMEGANIVAMGYGLDVHNSHKDIRKWFRERKIRMVRFPYYTREIFAMSDVDYPDEIFEAINDRVWRQVYGARQIRITDPLGTDLTVELDEGYWQNMLRVYSDFYGANLTPDTPIFPGHIMVAPMISKGLKANGVIVATALHGGLIPRTKIYVENGRFVRAEGEGSFAEYIRHINERFKDITFPGAPGVGANFISEISIGTQPKVKRPPWRGLSGLPKFWVFAESRKRSGVIHISVGSPTAVIGSASGLGGIDLFDFAKRRGFTVQHVDIELYHVTYYVDGKKIIENGRLLALDDPEIRKIAEKYGDPEELLREDWIPDELGN